MSGLDPFLSRAASCYEWTLSGLKYRVSRDTYVVPGHPGESPFVSQAGASFNPPVEHPNKLPEF